MIQAWWIHRWYFLYISVCMILHIAALFKSFQFRHITYFSQYIVLQTTYFIQTHFYLVIHLTLHYSFTYHLPYYRFSNVL